MIASLWANSNWDDDKGTRQSAIEELEAKYTEAIDAIHELFSGSPRASEASQEEIVPGTEAVELDKSNPFFAAVDRGQARLAKRLSHVTNQK